MKIVLPVLLILVGFASQARAEVYKCRTPDGRTEISNSPCAGGSSTIKSVQDDVVPDDVRAKAQRDADRMRSQADRLGAERRADEKEERAELARQRKESGLPSQAKVNECLATVARLSVDSSRRAELEAGCQTSGTVQPVFVETPYYYGGGGYIRPHPPRPPRPPKPEQLPQPLPQPAKPSNPASPSGKPTGEYAAPGNYRAR